MRNIRLSLALLTLLTLSASLRAENWPGWRGPRGDGTSAEANVPIRWSATENVAWKVAVPYPGHSSPIVWSDHVFLTGADPQDQARKLMALDRRTGKMLWERTVLTAPLEKKHNLNSFASSTPATDGERVYVSFLNVDRMHIAAYDFQGNELWTAQPGPFSSMHGYCSSPVLHEGKVIVNGDHDGDAFLVALDAKTGEVLWKTPRENRERSYCTPIVREIGGRALVILSGNGCVVAYEAENGSMVWTVDGPTEQMVASLVENRGLIFVTGGYPDRHILTIDPTGRGNVTDSHVRWQYRKGVSYVPSPVAAGPYFYVAADNGVGTCFDAVTGDVQWQERLARHYSASLWTAGEHVYFLDDDGTTKVVPIGPAFDVIAENHLAEPTIASPAVSQGQIFIRTIKHLYCIGRK